MENLFKTFTKNTQKQLRKQGDKHAMEIAVMKQANMDTHIILTTNTIPTQSMNEHIMAAHFTVTTKPSETLFDGTPENWPAFEHHLLTEAENPT
jgi:hypothetical protein